MPVSFANIQKSSHPFNGDPLTGENILPGGARLKASAFSAPVPAGTLVARADASSDSEYIPYDSSTHSSTDDVFLTAHDVQSSMLGGNVSAPYEVALYRHNRLVYSDRLPSGVDKTKVAELYQTTSSS